jgi:hypothetical protein
MAETNYTLVIGDKNLSSWSLRPWIALKVCDPIRRRAHQA